MEHPLRYASYATIGLLIGAASMALGAFLASADNGWANAIMYSAVGVVGAPLAAVAWATRRYRRRLICSGVALLAGLAATMGILLELTAEFPHIVHATSQSPLAVAGWFVIWVLWISAALARLILFEPPKTRHRLSSRRGDGGA